MVGLALQALVALLGVAMIVSAIAQGGGPLALGVVLGAAFVFLGGSRIWLARRAMRGRS